MNNVHPKPFQIVKIDDGLYRILRYNLRTQKDEGYLPNLFTSFEDAKLFINELMDAFSTNSVVE